MEVLFMKRKLCFLLIFILIFSIVPLANAADAAKVMVDGKILQTDVPPTIISSRTLVPLRAIFEALGVEVEWDNSTQTVTGIKDTTEVNLTVGNTHATINGDTVILDVPATIINGRTLVPARFIAESIGCNVDWDDNTRTAVINTFNQTSDNEATDRQKIIENLKIHFIDVGQGDSILIQQGDRSMLIDAGDNQYEQRVVNYLKQNNVSKLDYVIGTHPHADHIGGLDAVINAFNIEKVIMPKVTHTSQTFEDVIIAIKNKGLKITTPHAGDTYTLGNAEFTIVAPNSSSYNNLNNYSIVLKLKHGNNSFLFTGDAENISENEILNKNHDINADVLKVGHHGSTTSTTPQFLNAVDPKYAVIQVGGNNRYGHPHTEVIERLLQRNIVIYRNDLHGTIIANSDGENIKFKIGTSPQQPNAPPIQKKEISPATQDTIQASYIGNKNSKIFHYYTCFSLPIEKNRVYFEKREEAMEAGYKPCQRCNP
jgi:competence protein ComEC